MSRDSFTLGDNAYDLSHLEPFVVEVSPKHEGAPKFNVLVTFGCHTFTRDITETDPHELRYVEGTETRCFCHVRHGHSTHLPAIVKKHVGGRVFFSEGRNLLCVEWLDGLEAPYAVFFNLVRWREKGLHAAMNVVSAYGKANLPDRLPCVTFATLVSSVVNGQSVKVPTDRRSIKK